MATRPVRQCPRCGHTTIGTPIIPAGALYVCVLCGTFNLARELGEMTSPDDRADPDEWGPASWH